MVLFKRKPVVFVPPPDTPSDLDCQVWTIPETNEWFLQYDDYLARLDYYNTRKFVCEATGITNYTFWEALQIESQEIEKMQQFFPEVVKEPMLRLAQFSEVQRLDILIDQIYNKFRGEFFPGDIVNVKNRENKYRQKGAVKEKARFNPISLPDGQTRKPYCQYRVALFSNDKEIACDESELYRDRTAFTKQFIRSFLKLALTKSPRVGSPWVVKDAYAKKYRISADYPEHMAIFKKDIDVLPVNREPPNGLYVNLQPLFPLPQHNKKKKLTVVEQFRQHMYSHISENEPLVADQLSQWQKSWVVILGHCTVYIDNSEDGAELKDDLVRLFKAVNSTIVAEFDSNAVNMIITSRSYSNTATYDESDIFHNLNESTCKVWTFTKALDFFKKLEFTVDEPTHEVSRPTMTYESFQKGLRPLLPKDLLGKLPTPAALKQQSSQKRDSPAPAVVVPKLPVIVEDLELPFQSITQDKKPQWKSIEVAEITKISELLETWCFFNIYRKALVLDSFTLDDYITAINWQNTDIECQLLTEIICSALKCILNDDVKVGGNNTHGISKDENAIGDGENYLVLIPRKGGYVVEEETPAQNGNGVKEEGGVKSETMHNDTSLKEEPDADGDVLVNDIKRDSDDDVVLVEDQKNLKSEDDTGDQQEDQEEEGEGEVVEEEEEEEVLFHNVEKYLFYKKKTWQDRLRKRQFGDGQWLIVLLGVLSLVEHVPRHAESIREIFNILAPTDMAVSTATLEHQFYTELPVDLKITVVTIICELITSGVVIRNYIDKCLEDSAHLRKEKFENVREYKSYMDQASALNKTCIEYLNAKKDMITVVKKPVDPNAKKNRGGRPPALKAEPTEQELALAEVDKDFAKMIKERADFLASADEAKRKRKEFDRQLNELDIQRITFIGQDRSYNRYWWFETNGLPTLRSRRQSSDDEEDEGDVDEENVEDENYKSESDAEEAGMKDETYLVGRLFVQGPSDDDRSRFLEIDDNIASKWLTHTIDAADAEVEPQAESQSVAEIERDFKLKCEGIIGYKFEEDMIKSKEDKVILDKEGKFISDNSTKLDRKLLEERPTPLISRDQWKYIDKPEDLAKLIESLNKEGLRELQLSKELELLGDDIKASMDARIKALGLEKKSKEEMSLEEQIEAIAVSDSEAYEDEEEDEEDEEEASAPEYDHQEQQQDEVNIPSNTNDSEFSESSEVDDEEELISTGRRTRTSRRIKDISARRAQARSRPERRTRSARGSAPAVPAPTPTSSGKRKATRKQPKKSKRQRLKLHEEKVKRKEKLVEMLENLKNNRNEVRCLEWVNSAAIDEFGDTHLNSAIDTKAKNRKKK